MYKLKTYFDKNLMFSETDTPTFTFKTFKEVQNHFEIMAESQMIDGKKGFYKKSDTIYVFTYKSDNAEVIITEKIYFITDLMDQGVYFGLDTVLEFSLYGFSNYENAYKAALLIKQGELYLDSLRTI
jgi:hypothetical protein